jgi:aspartyl-tRNA(Asn)/glutamyl-tRNA(Gln) amidotransferase subunit C
MTVKREEVLRIAKLAHLRLGADELERMTGDLNSILGHVDQLASLEDGGGPDRRDAGEGSGMRSREDTGGERALDPSGIAPSWKDGFFLVPPPPGLEQDGGE